MDARDATMSRTGRAPRSRLATALVAGAVALVSIVTLVAAPQPAAAAVPVFPVAAGGSHSCALTSTNGVRCWGLNVNGQLGNGSTTQSATPVDLTTIASGATAVTAGLNHACAVVQGAVKCWGYNATGQLGDGTANAAVSPVTVSGLSAVAVAAGTSHTCAVLATGGVKCWGLGTSGRLGYGSTLSSATPVDVTGLASGATAITSGTSHTCALVGGGVKCWGANSGGQLGNGGGPSSSVPVDVIGLTSGVTAIAAFNSHTCAVTSAGGVKCWGLGSSGQLGNGLMATSPQPVDVTGLSSGIRSIAAGGTHSCAVTTGGGVKCWGAAGRIGDTGTASATPVDVAALSSGVTAISAGTGHTCALLSGGSLRCWGVNTYGQLGNGQASGAPEVLDARVQTVLGGSTYYGASVAPTITGSRSPAANANGWNNEPVTVSFTCVSPALLSCTSPQTLGTNGGNQSVTGTAVASGGATATAVVSGISIDRSPPSLSAVATTSPNAQGWYNAPVTMAWSCADTWSGIAGGACPANAQATGEGVGVTVSASVVDKAGNQTTASSQAVKIDRTKPSTGVSSPPTWATGDVTLALTATDALSGVATVNYRIDGGATRTGTQPVVSGQGVHTLEYWATDLAGNIETTRSAQVRIDVQAPSITVVRSVPPNANGWNNGPVTVTFVCGDEAGGSGVASCSAPSTFTSETDTTVTGAASDAAGNAASVNASVRIDQTAPTVTAEVPAANANGWFNVPVQVPFTCSDSGGSGIATCPAPSVFAGDGADQPVSGQAVDAAGNTADATGATVSIDTTAPSISGAAIQPSNPDGGFFGTVTVRWTCDDDRSGVVACPADQQLSAEGVHVVSGSVTDRAGNTSTAEVTIQVNHDPSTDPGKVHGTITDSSNGGVVAGAQVTLRTPANAIVATTTTGTDGTYTFPAVADGSYKIQAALNKVYQGSYRPGTFTVARGTSTTADHALEPTLTLSGTVRSTSGAPVAGATVRISPSSLVAVTDAAGNYQVTGLLPGPVTVRVLATGYLSPADASLTVTGPRVYDVALTAAAAGGGVKGTITQTGGAPLAGATVRIWLKGSTVYSQTVSTGADGRYSVPSLAEGTYEIDVVRVDYQVRWFGDSLARTGAAPVTITTGCTAAFAPAWGDPCAFPADVVLRN